MQDRIQIVSIVAAAVLLLVIFELVRRRRLLERYALLWLGSGVVLLGLAIWRGVLEKLGITASLDKPHLPSAESGSTSSERRCR